MTQIALTPRPVTGLIDWPAGIVLPGWRTAMPVIGAIYAIALPFVIAFAI